MPCSIIYDSQDVAAPDPVGGGRSKEAARGYAGTALGHKEGGVSPLATARGDPEGATLREASQRKTNTTRFHLHAE